MEQHFRSGLKYYTFKSLAAWPQLRHGVFTRQAPPDLGGELTFSFREDIPDSRVQRSLALAEEALGLGPAVFVLQTHSDRIYLHDPSSGYAPRKPGDIIQGYDALVARPGTLLLLKLADCQGILLFHPPSGILALIHSGWRGSVQNIAGRTAAFLEKELSVPPPELRAAVSPSLGPCCAEFINYEKELPPSMWSYQNPADHHFDFWKVTRDQLTAAGVKPQNIETAGICTKCDPDFPSYRRGDRGRFALAAGVIL
ncbi:MAG: polyphenol oxidase family protein [Deltaproteobacteria bacterium]|jgi:copper oxidase (laccase) domain-containing protein|nr:polyphenol oxidase family protein [Deltaproteobacteria bacterium]